MSQKIDGLPTAIEKRDLLFGVKKSSMESWKSWAQSFLGADWISDGIDFLMQTKDRASLEALYAKVSAEGNVFLLQKILRVLGVNELSEVETKWLRECSQKAESLGLYRYAIKGYERLGLTIEAERVRALVAEDGDIIAEMQAAVFIPPTEEEVEGHEEDEG